MKQVAAAGAGSEARRTVAAMLVCVVVLTGCGKASSTVVRPPVSRAPASTPSSLLPTTTLPTTTLPPTTGPLVPRITVTPANGLTSGQRVTVTGSGFTPGEALVVTECADKGASTGPGDCNIEGIVPTTSDATGAVRVDVTLDKGPFGANQIVCGGQQRCLVSVSQATPSPTEQADTSIAFQ